MSRKGENIYKRKDGRWEARYIKEGYTIATVTEKHIMKSEIRSIRHVMR